MFLHFQFLPFFTSLFIWIVVVLRIRVLVFLLSITGLVIFCGLGRRTKESFQQGESKQTCDEPQAQLDLALMRIAS